MRVLRIMLSIDSSFKFRCLLFAVPSTSNCLLLLRSVFPSVVFQKAVPTHDVTNPASFPSFLPFIVCRPFLDRLCGLVVRVSGYRDRGLGFDSRRYQIFLVVVGLERGPLSLVRSIEELLE